MRGQYGNPRFAKAGQGTPKSNVKLTEGQIEVKFESNPGETIKDKFSPKVTRIKKEDLGNEKSSHQNAGWESGYDVGRGMGEVGKGVPANTEESRRINNDRRRAVVEGLNIDARPAEQLYTSKQENIKVSGEIKVLPDTFINTVKSEDKVLAFLFPFITRFYARSPFSIRSRVEEVKAVRS